MEYFFTARKVPARNSFLLLFLFFSFFSSCKKDTPLTSEPDLGFDYFPLETGSWIIYDVDSVVHDDYLDSVISFSFQIMETVESKYTDFSGKEVFRIERYKRAGSSSPWIISDVWAAHINASRAERFEENTWYVKLIFPVRDAARWNGNAFNSMDEDEYEYTEVDVPGLVNGHQFDSTLTVLQEDDLNVISKLFSEEKYARNIGMVYRQYINLDLQKDAGLEMTMKINSYGK